MWQVRHLGGWAEGEGMVWCGGKRKTIDKDVVQVHDDRAMCETGNQG